MRISCIYKIGINYKNINVCKYNTNIMPMLNIVLRTIFLIYNNDMQAINIHCLLSYFQVVQYSNIYTVCLLFNFVKYTI